MATVRDRRGRVTRVYHDALRRVVGVRDPLGRTVQQIWGADNVLEKLVDAKQQATAWEYDVQSRVTREVRANGSDTTYTYEALGGQLLTLTDPEDQVKTYAYALDDALASVTYTNANVATPTVTYTYSTQYPRLATMVDGLGSTTYTYHAAGQTGGGRVASIDGPRTNDTLTYTYDELGRVTNRALNSVGVTWAYDALGRLTSEVNPLGTFAYTYDGVSTRLATSTYPNGQTTTYSYFGNSGDRRLQTIHHKLSGGATLSRFDYTYDVVGNLLSWQQQADAAAATKWTYGYDLSDQLVSAVKKTTDPTPTVLARYGYVYDAAGNRTSEQIDDGVVGASVDNLNRLVSHQPAGSMRVAGTLNEAASVTINGNAATVDASNAFSGMASIASGANAFTIVATDPAGNARTTIYDLTSSGSTKTFDYDANGNMTGDGTRTFEWDAENRLVAINIGTKRSEFTYSGDSQRTRIVEKDNGVVTRDAQLFWDDAEILEERLSTGALNRFFRDGEQHDGTARYVTRDHLDSVREVTSGASALLTRNEYDPFGRVVRVGGTEDSKFSFTGFLHHAPSGLVMARYRVYDSTVGRWLSDDPAVLSDTPHSPFDRDVVDDRLGLREQVGGLPLDDMFFLAPDGPNLQAYVRNNPINRIDPTGEWSVIVRTAARVVASQARRALTWVRKNVRVDGPSAGYQHSQGRMCQIRVRDRVIVRVDLHSRQPGGPPRWHMHVLPPSSGEHGIVIGRR